MKKRHGADKIERDVISLVEKHAEERKMDRGDSRTRRKQEIEEEQLGRHLRQIFWQDGRLWEGEIACGRLWACCVSCPTGIVVTNEHWVRAKGIVVGQSRNAFVATVCGLCEGEEVARSREQVEWVGVGLSEELVESWPSYRAVANECAISGLGTPMVVMSGDVVSRRLVLRAHTEGLLVKSTRVVKGLDWEVDILDGVTAEFLEG